MTRDPLLKWRKEFPILQKSTYLISNSLGAMPRSVYGKMRDYAETWATRGVRAWSDAWWEMSVSVGDDIAPLIGAKAGEISMHTNISLLQSILISCFDFSGRRKTIVLTEMEFPSVLYVYEQFARSRGAKLKIVRSDDGISVPTEKLLKAIDETTLLVPISHVLFRSGYIQDVRAISEKARRCGALVILDAYHSAGILPVNVGPLGVDVLVGGVLKWLCGGPGGAFLWIRRSLSRKLSPTITGWFAHRRPFAFEPEMKYSAGVSRFLNGTPSIPSLYAAGEGPRIIAAIGIDAIRAKSQRQTALLVNGARERGYKIITPMDPARRGGTVTIGMPHAYEISRELLRREILVDYREGGGIRIAPHFYTSDEELARTLDETEQIIATRTYRRHRASRSKVT